MRGMITHRITPRKRRLLQISLLVSVLLGGMRLRADEQEQLRVGVQPDGRIVVPTNQILQPAGKQITFPGRPVDLLLVEGGDTLVIKNQRNLVFVAVASATIKQTLALPVKKKADKSDSKEGLSVVGLLALEDRVYVSDFEKQVCVARRQPDGRYSWEQPFELKPPGVGGAADPAGMAARTPTEIWVTSTRGNSIQQLNLVTGKAEQAVAVGVAPYALCWVNPDTCYVSNWGGDPPATADPQGTSSGSPVRIDPRTGVANHGSVSVVARVAGHWRQVKTIPVGLHPCGLILSPHARFAYVANANSDTVSVIDTGTHQVTETIDCRPEARLPFGSGSNALALGPDGGTLYVANGTNNCVAVIRLGRQSRERPDAAGPEQSELLGLIPTAWYPGAVCLSADGSRLFVANVKGLGALSQPRPAPKGRNSHDHLGAVSLIDVPGPARLAEYTAAVNRNNRLGYSLAGLQPPRAGVPPVPVPVRHGEPSVFKHVLYIIKENRTYDQVFGDVREGNGDPNLVLFGEEVTPNHHALARQFTLLDNFYCSGVLSADGHSWTNAAYVTDYLEKAFGGFTRSYPDDGRDPLAFPMTGFLWDNALARGKTLRIYGEFVAEEDYTPKGTTWADLYADFKNDTSKVPITIRPTQKRLEAYTHPRYPYFPLVMPDVYRARLFLADLQEFEKRGEMPNLLYMSLPCDHTEGTTPGFPTPRAMVADNDLALGRIVEAVSRSRFWKDTCILVVEDDPQNGFDHVDGHRTVALAISPYTRRRFVDSTNYNQTGMVKTIELMLGLPAMNQLDLSATPMRRCFQNEADLAPYTALPNRVPLDEMNPPVKQLTGSARHWALKSLELNLRQGDRADEDTLNRILWHSVRGDNVPYPERFTGRAADRD
jgi:YVTN family beta-propeller protein